MLTYWLLFLLPLVGVILDPKLKSPIGRLGWIIVVVVCILVVGLRETVGCDWSNYVDFYERFSSEGITYFNGSLKAVVEWGPAYVMLNWLSIRLDLNIYLPNLVCAALALIGLAILCRQFAFPWLGWTVATPYLITVVNIGYTRQAAAIGLFCWGLSYLEKRKSRSFIYFIIGASTFHVSALVLSPLALIHKIKDNPKRYSMVLFILITTLVIVFGSDIANQIRGYIISDRHSTGAAVRTFMTAIPSTLLLIFYKDWLLSTRRGSIWFVLAIAGLCALGPVWFMSTATDRIGLYLIPLQIYVWSTIPAIVRFEKHRTLLTSLIVMYSAAVLFVWLNFGQNSRCWTPYQNLLFTFEIY